MKVSASAIEELKLGTSTQKCKAVNRSLSVSLPKHNDFPRNVQSDYSKGQLDPKPSTGNTAIASDSASYIHKHSQRNGFYVISACLLPSH